MDYIDLLSDALSWACVAVTLASLITVATGTPDPNTKLGRVYRLVEALALLVGKAKQGGMIRANPRADRLGDAIADAIAAVRATPPAPKQEAPKA